eukprot:gene11141-62388_t
MIGTIKLLHLGGEKNKAIVNFPEQAVWCGWLPVACTVQMQRCR